MSTYKETLHLPQTDFPMKAGLPQREPEILARWEKERLYEKIQTARAGAPEYILHDGPPFANGDVHMGTALNKVLKDLVIKSKTMAGFRAPFVPGWDCHGLPIEFKVVKESAGLNPVEIRERCEQYARKFIDIQRGQFKRLGVLGDWENPYLTLDPGYEAEIIRAFGEFVAQGLVYRKRKPVRWSYGAKTALAEAEVENEEKTSLSVFVKFPIVEGPWAGASLAIWTTTPWTLPANLAVAVHANFSYVVTELPGHGRLILAEALLPALAAKLGLETPPVSARFPGQELVGTRAHHPFLERTAEVYAADFVTLEIGTGLVHIAPGHGDDDYQLGLAHGLSLLSPVDDEGRFTEECGVPELVGQNVFAANPRVVEILAEKGALLLAEDYLHSYPHCWRSKTPVIFRAVEQFFINVDALRERALAAVDGAEWIPARGRTRIRGTVESRPDWCISRQRTWGVPLPVFYREDGEPILDPALIERVAQIVESEGTNAWFAWSDAQWNEKLGLPPGTSRRSDTLDVWIDSGVSHRAVLDRHPALHAPADLYLEATDQHRGWFQSSLMTSVALRHGAAPYRAVLTHGFVVDFDTKRKISKSEAAVYQKPTNADHYMKEYGADLLRLWVCSVNFTDDVPFSEQIFTRLSDTYRRLRNTLRILLGNLHDFDPARDVVPFERMPEVDRWILGELHLLIDQCTGAYGRLEFHKVYQLLTQFCAVELSSQYVDITKDRLYCDALNSPRRRATQTAMAEIFSSLCRLLAPILCFTAEEAWGYFQPGESVHLQTFPTTDPAKSSDSAVATVRTWREVRAKTAQAMEAATKAGTISNPLEAQVRITLPENEFASMSHLQSEVEEFLILSHLELQSGTDWHVEIQPTPRKKCERCWRHRDDLGTDPNHPTLCARCTEAVHHAEAC
jgi:isoleucyl-tRNA synthetase